MKSNITLFNAHNFFKWIELDWYIILYFSIYMMIKLYKYFEQVLNEDLFKKKYSDSKDFWRDQAKLSPSNLLNKFQKK
jgi:hypothetical protein